MAQDQSLHSSRATWDIQRTVMGKLRKLRKRQNGKRKGTHQKRQKFRDPRPTQVGPIAEGDTVNQVLTRNNARPCCRSKNANRNIQWTDWENEREPSKATAWRRTIMGSLENKRKSGTQNRPKSVLSQRCQSNPSLVL
jgi:hypothetical protein